MPNEKGYIDKTYCLECASKHANRLEHHFEDTISATQNEPELRLQAQEMLDQIRQMRKKVDELRIQQLAKDKLKQTI